jgi:hypothetical protein
MEKRKAVVPKGRRQSVLRVCDEGCRKPCCGVYQIGEV